MKKLILEQYNDRLNVVNDYKNNMGSEEICKKFHINIDYFKEILEEFNILSKDYPNHNIKLMNLVSDINQNNQLTSDEIFHNFDENIFNFINTKEKAYWLGFIYSCNNIMYEEFCLNFTLPIEQEDFLRKFCNFLKINKKAIQYKDNNVTLRFCSKLIYDNFLKFKIKEKQIINFDIKFNKFFIQGYFNGCMILNEHTQILHVPVNQNILKFIFTEICNNKNFKIFGNINDNYLEFNNKHLYNIILYIFGYNCIWSNNKLDMCLKYINNNLSLDFKYIKIIIENKINSFNYIQNLDKENIILDYLSGEQIKKLSEIYKISKQKITIFLYQNGISLRNPQEVKSRKIDLNINYFDDVNTEQKAYFLGFLYADGYNKLNKSISITLKESDRHILKDLLALVSNQTYESRVYKYSKTTEYEDKAPITRGYERITWRSAHFSRKLAELGMVENKSLILKFPKWLEKSKPNLISHFLRGYLDGDGSIYKTIDGEHRLAFTSSSIFINDLQKYLNKNLGVNGYISVYKNNLTSDLIFGGAIQAECVCDFLYRDATIFLDRKYKQFQILKNRKKI